MNAIRNTYHFLFDPHSLVSYKAQQQKMSPPTALLHHTKQVPRVCKETLQEILFQSDLLRSQNSTMNIEHCSL